MLTPSTVLPLLAIISNYLEPALCQTCLRQDVDRNCLQEDAERSSAQDQDGDLVSFLQAGGSQHLTFATGVKGSRQETLTGPAAKSSSTGRHKAPVPNEPPMIFALTKFADHCEMFARDVFGAGYEWVLPVIIVVMVLIAVGFYSFVIMRDEQRPDITFRARPFSTQPREENFPTIIPESFPTIPPANFPTGPPVDYHSPANFPSGPPADAPVFVEEPRRSDYGNLYETVPPLDVPLIIEEPRRTPAVEELPSVSMQQPEQAAPQFPPTWAGPAATAPLRSPSHAERSPSKEGMKAKSINDLPATASLILSRPDNGVPPLCPTLVLKTFESQFAINIEDMEQATTGSELSVCGFDSRPVLKLKINDSESGTRLDIYVDNTTSKLPADAKPRCSIIAPQDDTPDPFVIRGPGDKHYGIFRAVAGKNAQFEIVVDGRPIVVIEGETSSEKMQLDAFTPDPHNHPVAMAAKNVKDYKGGEPCFEIRVLPGYDAMLVIAVVMAMMLFIDHD